MRTILAVLVVALFLVSAAGLGCDRTRPYGGTQEPTEGTVTATQVPPPPSTGGIVAEGPAKTAAGWKFTYSAPQANTVHLAGSFNDWSTTADPMKKGPDGVWYVTKTLDSGSYPYKFVINGSEWKEDPANPESIDDGYGGKNSVLTVP